jgi:hypothetical protein
MERVQTRSFPRIILLAPGGFLSIAERPPLPGSGTNRPAAVSTEALFRTVCGGVLSGGFLCVLGSMQMVRVVGYMGMVRGLLVIARLVVFCRLGVVVRGLGMMVGCMLVVLGCLLGHAFLLCFGA